MIDMQAGNHPSESEGSLQDDEGQVEALVRESEEKGWSPAKLVQEMLKRGIIVGANADPTSKQPADDSSRPQISGELNDGHEIVGGPAAAPTIESAPAPHGLSRRGLLTLFGGLAAGGVGVGVLLSNSNKPAPTDPIPSPDQPATSPDTVTPSPSASEELPTLESEMEDNLKVLKQPNRKFVRLLMEDRQGPVDAMFALVALDNKVGAAFTETSHPNDPGIFAESEGRDLSEFSPVFLAADGKNNLEATAQEILNQLVFARTAVFGQQEDPKDINNDNLDQNTAANMVSGCFYDIESPAAKAMTERALKSKKALSTGPKHYVKESAIQSSNEALKEHAFGFGPIKGPIAYKVINYNLGDGPEYKIVTPYKSIYRGPNPIGTGEIVELTVIKWLEVGKGKGEEETEGPLRNY